MVVVQAPIATESNYRIKHLKLQPKRNTKDGSLRSTRIERLNVPSDWPPMEQQHAAETRMNK